MNNHLVKTEQKSEKQHRIRKSTIVKDLKQILELALLESNWANTISKAKGIHVLEHGTIKGDSDLSWTPDLMIPGKTSGDVCCAFFCVDNASRPRIEGLFDRALAACIDLDFIASLRVVVVNNNGPAPVAGRQLVSKYKKLFGSNGDDVKVLDWDQKNICDVVQQILAELQRMYPDRAGVEDIDYTMRSLAQKHPDPFGYYSIQASQGNRVLDLLQKIKKLEPSLTFGKIILRAFRNENLCELRLPFELQRVSDKDLEETLSKYFEGARRQD
jgi:hypothetical protein